MPELPEVETIKREFSRELIGRRIESVDVLTASVINVPPAQFIERIKGADFKSVTRRAKYLVIGLSNDYSLIIHLKISGQLLYLPADSLIDSYTHIIFTLDNGKQLRLRDVNSFTSISLLKTKDVLTFFAHKGIGPEPLNPDFDYDLFRSLIKRHRAARIKPLLIDQHFIAGIGNIYADEILFYARVHPSRKVSELSEADIHNIYEGLKNILVDAIEHHGTSTRYYVDLLGQKGDYQNNLKVHARVGKPCDGCPGEVEEIKVSGKETYLCTSCQG